MDQILERLVGILCFFFHCKFNVDLGLIRDTQGIRRRHYSSGLKRVPVMIGHLPLLPHLAPGVILPLFECAVLLKSAPVDGDRDLRAPMSAAAITMSCRCNTEAQSQIGPAKFSGKLFGV